MMNIEDLLNKYFDGETTHREEMELRQFFAKGAVPKEWEAYKPLFAYLDAQATPPVRRRSVSLVTRISLIAACALIALVVTYTFRHTTPVGNYVIIDGKCYTDPKIIRSNAQAAFSEMQMDKEEIFQTLFQEE